MVLNNINCKLLGKEFSSIDERNEYIYENLDLLLNQLNKGFFSKFFSKNKLKSDFLKGCASSYLIKTQEEYKLKLQKSLIEQTIKRNTDIEQKISNIEQNFKNKIEYQIKNYEFEISAHKEHLDELKTRYSKYEGFDTSEEMKIQRSIKKLEYAKSELKNQLLSI